MLQAMLKSFKSSLNLGICSPFNKRRQSMIKLLATWEKISNRGQLLSCLAKCYYVGNLPNSTGQASYFSIHGLLLLNLLKGLLWSIIHYS